ncbi:Hpt domain-containing protein [Hoeflea ulvae]|uniref:Hpt domain-containing protein n=1 Tax=Hoeflea ulvae TaxID=2983764 RepID=A0ABT3YCR0_9HYPH|nr:Hpt domain-containing protein [Hoeflea ulvae]MCY0093648.1 Hpt domain-containing protein [Hoeflea ulvae]
MASQAHNGNQLDKLSDEAKDRVAQLRLLFVERCKENLAQIRQILGDPAEAGGLAQQQRADLIKLAHSLAGASAIFGYKELGVTAFKVETKLREAKYREADLAQILDELMDQLTALV